MKILDFLQKHHVPYQNLSLYVQAFTHSSYANEQKSMQDYERLEFMGDAILQLYVSRFLYHKYPEASEGTLTTYRSKLVREESLSRFAVELGLDQLLYLGVGEERSGGRERPAILCDVFEAFIGALYLDCGEDTVLYFLEKTIFLHSDDVDDYEDIIDYKSKLQELIQSDERKSVTYHMLHMTGPANAPEFEVAAVVEDVILGYGKGTSKKRAEQQSAKDALMKLAKL